MQIKEITKEEAAVWILRDELAFMIAATERALNEMDPDEFDPRTGRTVDYANTILARLKFANGEKKVQEQSQMRQHIDQVYSNFLSSDKPAREQATMRVEVVADDKALVSISDHELRFLKNAINEAIHGLHGVKEFERTSGRTSKYGRGLMHHLIAVNDRIEALN